MPGEQWTDELTRVDGVRITRHPDDATAWIVVADGVSIDVCPCCDKRLLSTRSARMVADVVYPVRRPAA